MGGIAGDVSDGTGRAVQAENAAILTALGPATVRQLRDLTLRHDPRHADIAGPQDRGVTADVQVSRIAQADIGAIESEGAKHCNPHHTAEAKDVQLREQVLDQWFLRRELAVQELFMSALT